MANVMLSAGIPERIDGVEGIVVIIVAALAVVCLQFFCCWKWQNFFIRILPGAVGVGLITTFFILMTRAAEKEIAEGFATLVEIFGIMLCAVLVGWLVWLIYCIAHNKISRNPAGY